MNIYDLIPSYSRDFKLNELAIVAHPDAHHTDPDCRAEYPIGTVVRIVAVFDDHYECKDCNSPPSEDGWYYSDRELKKLVGGAQYASATVAESA